jgi:hypothetical protein
MMTFRQYLLRARAALPLRGRTGIERPLRRRVRPSLESLEDRTVLAVHLTNGVLQVAGDNTASGQSNTIVISRTAKPNTIQVQVDGNIEYTGLMSAVTSITVNGAGPGVNDTVTVDFSSGNPIPAGGLTFNGSTGTNTLALTGGSTFTNEVETPSGPQSGNVVFDGTTTITYKNVATIDDTTSLPGSATYNGTAAGEIIHLVDGGIVKGVRATQLDSGSSATFATVLFANKPTVLVQGGEGGADTVTINNPHPAAGLVHLTFDAQGSGDVISVLTTPASVSTTVTSTIVTGITDTVNVGNAGSSQGILGSLSIQNPAGFTNLTLDDSADGTARTVSLATGFITGLTPGAITYVPTDLASLTINGGSGGNTFNVASTLATTLGTLPGTSAFTTVNGGKGNNVFTINASGLGALSLNSFDGQGGNDSFTVTGAVPIGVSLTLNAGTGNDTFNVGGLIGAATAIGGGGSDTVVAVKNAGFNLSDTSLTATDALALSLSGVANAQLTSGLANILFIVANWTGNATLTGTSDVYDLLFNGTGHGTINVADSGPAGTNLLIVGGTAQADTIVITPTWVGRTGETINYSGIQDVHAYGQGGQDIFYVYTNASTTLRAYVDAGTATGDILSVVDSTPGASARILSAGAGMGVVEVNHGGGPKSYVQFQQITTVATYPDPLQSYVQDVYQAALHRVASTQEAVYWATYLNQTGDRLGFVNSLLTSAEGRTAEVDGWYLKYAGRTAVGGEDQFWVNQLLGGQTDEQVLSDFLSAVYANLPPDAFINALYGALLGRGPAATELAIQESALASVGRAGVAYRVLTSLEYHIDVVLADYTTYFHLGVSPPTDLDFGPLLQGPTVTGNDVLNLAASDKDLTQITETFLSSPTFSSVL